MGCVLGAAGASCVVIAVTRPVVCCVAPNFIPPTSPQTCIPDQISRCRSDRPRQVVCPKGRYSLGLSPLGARPMAVMLRNAAQRSTLCSAYIVQHSAVHAQCSTAQYIVQMLGNSIASTGSSSVGGLSIDFFAPGKPERTHPPPTRPLDHPHQVIPGCVTAAPPRCRSSS